MSFVPMNRSFRRGYSLPELLVVMTFASVLLVIATRQISAMLRVQRKAEERRWQSASLDRLFQQFRTDVHRSERILKLHARRKLRLKLAGGETVEYATTPDRVERRLRRGAEEPRRELFGLAAGSEVEFGQDKDSPRRVTMTIRRLTPGGSRGKIGERSVLATLGRDLRFAPTILSLP